MTTTTPISTADRDKATDPISVEGRERIRSVAFARLKAKEVGVDGKQYVTIDAIELIGLLNAQIAAEEDAKISLDFLEVSDRNKTAAEARVVELEAALAGSEANLANADEALGASEARATALLEALRGLYDMAGSAWFADDGTDSQDERDAMFAARAAINQHGATNDRG